MIDEAVRGLNGAVADARLRVARGPRAEHLGTIVDAEQDVFTELNDAGWTGGAFVYVPRDVRVERRSC